MSILWNCTSVILLVTWTSFHPWVGISRKQRIFTTMTAILVPELPALIASSDFLFAVRLWRSLKSSHEWEGWNEGWTLTKSFLVVKGGIRVRPHQRHRHINHSGIEQSSDTATDNVIDPETFLVLARVGSIRYEDFPAAEEIHDKSKADRCAKSITLFQLLWAIANLWSRSSNNYTVSLLEQMVLNWIVFGLCASILWWKCPQNIIVPYHILVRDYRELTGLSHVEHDSDPSTVMLRDRFKMAIERKLNLDKVPSDWFDSWIYLIFLPYTTLQFAQLTPLGFYEWHSAHAKAAWVTFTLLSFGSNGCLMCTILLMHWSHSRSYIQRGYIKLLMLGHPEPSEHDTEPVSKWLGLATGMGFHNLNELKPVEDKTKILVWGSGVLKTLVVSVSVALLCQFAKLVIALTAFANAPRDIYDVPNTWILEAFMHVGG